MVIFISLKPIVQQKVYQNEVTRFKKVRSISAIKDKNYVVFIGKETCSACKDFMINNFLRKKLDTKTYYIDTDSMKIEDKINLLEKFDISTVPTVIYVKNGKEIRRTHSYSKLAVRQEENSENYYRNDSNVLSYRAVG
ncbi:thioredoxin family protein [Lactobacillus sp. DCY120]|uniref:Thioredoxin family protein n=1 Tax=Bombilactobacillus apium TaxID=2675299 RepID=A0A850R8G0_9LACO|nr:thioredoxin family protein [Bombilactobacillus apium]NVY97137.1 thioredoxin family protein [Bombilactobacillus apium]